MDNTNALRTYYFAFEANEARTLTIDNFGPSDAQWTPDGFWGAEAGLDAQNIKLIALYVWEAKTETPADTEISYIVDNIRIVQPNALNFDKISFEDGET